MSKDESLTPLDLEQTHGEGEIGHGRRLAIPPGHPDALALQDLFGLWCIHDENRRNPNNAAYIRAAEGHHADRIWGTIEKLLKG